MAYAHVGELVLERREALGLSQQELADRVGASRSYISQIEGGNRKWPAKYVPALARALDLSEDELREAAGRKRPLRRGKPRASLEPLDGVSASMVAAIERLAPEQRHALALLIVVLRGLERSPDYPGDVVEDLRKVVPGNMLDFDVAQTYRVFSQAMRTTWDRLSSEQAFQAFALWFLVAIKGTSYETPPSADGNTETESGNEEDRALIDHLAHVAWMASRMPEPEALLKPSTGNALSELETRAPKGGTMDEDGQDPRDEPSASAKP